MKEGSCDLSVGELPEVRRRSGEQEDAYVGQQ